VRVEAIIVAAGKGKRFGKAQPKQFCPLKGKPIVCWTIAPFERCQLIDKIILIVPRGMREYVRGKILFSLEYKKIKTIAEGGKERTDSVFEGLKNVDEKTDIVLIHDGVRPLISTHLIEKVIKETEKYGAVSPAIPVKETLKEVNEDELVVRTLERSKIRLIQTPQGFKKDLIFQVYKKAMDSGWRASDDAGIVERFGYKVKVVAGEEMNIKITTSLDLKFAEMLLQYQSLSS